MQLLTSRIWTRVAVSISYDDNHYTTGTSPSDVIIVRNDTGWQGPGDVTDQKRAQVCVRIWREKKSGTRRQTRRIDFWSSQAGDDERPMGAAQVGGQMNKTT